ncbi:MAG: YdeI/OmpD-associated family protein [Acidobacteriaceae bacterium]
MFTLMRMSTRQRFRSLLKPDGTNLKWVIADVPFAPAKVWKTRNRMRVKGTINGFAFRTSLFGSSEKGYVLLVNKTMQKGAQAYAGEMAEFTLEPDLDERAAPVPPELAKLLKQERALERWFNALSYSYREYMADDVRKPKSAEARQRRAEQVAERMMLAMEGEQVLPPILQVAFRRAPLAHRGWNAMTAVQRRAHLLGIFYYQSPEARERRAQKAVEEALRVAEGRNVKSNTSLGE